MVKIIIDDKEIEIPDTLEKGEMELETLDGFPCFDTEINDDNTDTIKIKKTKLEDTNKLEKINDDEQYEGN